MQASDRVIVQGKPLDRLTAERLKSLSMLVKSSRFGSEKSDITLIQGIGGAAPSAGTHVDGGAYDITEFNYEHRVLGDRLLGGAGWHRPYLKGVWMGHIHSVTAGVGYAALSARRQVTAYYAGRNGLANDGKDTGPRLITRPLFVAPWTDRGKRGTYYLKRGVTARSEGTTKAASLGSIPKGARFTVIGVVNVDGDLWAINGDGKHVLKSNLTITKPAPDQPNVLKTTAGIRVAADGSATLNISCTKACSGWVQIWSDAAGSRKSDVAYYSFEKAGWKPLKFENVPVVTTKGAMARVKQRSPIEGVNPQFNPLSLTAEAPPLKPMTLRPMLANIPDETKMPNEAQRVPVAVAQMKSGNPDFILGQEWVGTGRDGSTTPSKLAASILKGMGTGYQLIVPKLGLNENYIILKTAAVTLVKQYPDYVIRIAGLEGKHLTMIVARDVASGRKVLIGNSQLEANDRPGAQAQAVLVETELQRVAEAEGGLPVIFGSDANDSRDLAAFASAGYVNTRTHAEATTDTKYASYTNKDKLKPSTNVEDWTIDQLWASPKVEVKGYTQIMGLNSAGAFILPRGSDHVVTLVSLVYP